MWLRELALSVDARARALRLATRAFWSLPNPKMDDLMLSFDSVPLPTILQRIEAGSVGLAGYCEVLKGRSALDEKALAFSTNVSRTALFENEISSSSTERAVGLFKNYYLFLSREQQRWYQKGAALVSEQEEIKRVRTGHVNKHKGAVENSNKDVKMAGEALAKAKKNFLKAKAECALQKEKLAALEVAVLEAVERARQNEDKKKEKEKEKGTFNRMLSAAFETTPEQERDKQISRVQRRMADLVSCSKEISARKKALTDYMVQRDVCVQQATQAFQALELERLKRSKSSMKKFCELEREACVERMKLLQTLEEAVETQSPSDDMESFIRTEKRSDLTLKYTKALALLDWDFSRRRLGGKSNVSSNDEAAAGGGGGSSSSSMTSSSRDSDFSLPLSEEGSTDEARPLSAQSSPISSLKKTATATEREGEESNAVAQTREALAAIFSLGGTPHEESLSPSPITPSSSSSSSSSSVASTPVTPAAGRNGGDVIEEDVSTPRPIEVTTEAQWSLLLREKAARDLFMQELDERRGSHGLLDRQGFDSMAVAMKVILDMCAEGEGGGGSVDVKTAMRIANMANTFYCFDFKDTDSEDSCSAAAIEEAPSSSSSSSSSSLSSTTTPSTTPRSSKTLSSSVTPTTPQLLPPPIVPKHHLLRTTLLRNHDIWKKSDTFWDAALAEGISSQMSNFEAKLWDELGQEALREAVLGVHNIVFGQLGVIAFTMHELDMPCEQVEKTILRMSREAQLAEEQEVDLLRSIRATYTISV